MSTKKRIQLLCAAADRESLQPIVEQLHAKGLSVSEDREAKKDDVVLAVLSENFYADAEKTEALFGLLGAGAENVLPLQMDGTPVPDKVKNVLYARNIIPTAGRDAEQIADRIASAVPPATRILPRILIAGAVVLALIAGIVIWRMSKKEKPAEEEPVQTVEETELDIYIPEGWTEEDLKKVVEVIIVGDRVELYTRDILMQNEYNYPDWDYFAYRDYEDHEARWYSREDGHEYSMTRYEDLRFLELLPELRFLTLAEVETGQLPDLSKNKRMESLNLMDCNVPDLEWVAGSTLTYVALLNTTGSVTDFSPLTSCEKLSRVHIDINNMRKADFTGFAPPALSWLWINGGDLQGELDLSSLSACTKLSECQLEGLPITDLNFLSGSPFLAELEVRWAHELRDISVLRGMKRLMRLQFEDPDSLTDYSPVSECTALEHFHLNCDGARPLRDASFLGNLPKLHDVGLYGVELQDIDFLVPLSEHQQRMDFGFWGSIRDYSGLGAFKQYGFLGISPNNGTTLDAILPYLEGASVENLQLYNFSEIDISSLPRTSAELLLENCGIRDLSTLPEDWATPYLTLNKCSALSSLDGLQKPSKFATLKVRYCPRLADWSALAGRNLGRLDIVGGFTVPEGVDFHANILRIESVIGVTDLGFLDALDAGRYWSFELVGLDELSSLQPLSRFHGSYLKVPPHLGEQAADLVKSGHFGEYEIEYPQGGWEQDNSEFVLESLDELETLPPALLRRVTGVNLAGDQIIDWNHYDVWDDYENNKPKALLVDKQTGKREGIKQGGFTDLTKFYQMTGLRNLSVSAQPVETIDGIQILSELDSIEFRCCPNLTDISPLFAMQNLDRISIRGCLGVRSIQGIQNLPHLMQLSIFRVNVSDLSPLASCDFSAAEENGGFELEMDDNPVKDFSALSSISHFRYICLNNMDCGLWMPHIQNARIDSFSSCNCGFTAESLAEFASAHPELRELNIPWNDRLNDLTPLLGMENLERVEISSNMKKAIASLEGQDYGFELRIQD